MLPFTFEVFAAWRDIHLFRFSEPRQPAATGPRCRKAVECGTQRKGFQPLVDQDIADHEIMLPLSA